MSVTIPTRFRIRRDTAANWTSENPVLLLGEPALETDTGKVKYGDGSTAWTSLSYAAGSFTIASNGLVARTAANTYTARTLTGTADEIAVTNGDGVSGNPTLAFPSSVVLTGKTLGIGAAPSDLFAVSEGGGRVNFGSPTANYLGLTFANAAVSLANYHLASNGGDLLIGRASGSVIRFREANSADQLAIASGGQVSITTTLRVIGHGTTASAANVFIDSGTGLISRSTSSLAYKRDVEPMDPSAADALLGVRTIWYRSAIETDRQDWSWYGLAAEDLARIDPRLVQWGYLPADYRKDGQLRSRARLRPVGVAYDRLTVPILNILQRIEKRLAALEAAARKA